MKFMSHELTSDKIMQLGLGFWGSKTLLSAIELSVFTELAKGPQNGESLRSPPGPAPSQRTGFLRRSRFTGNVRAEQRPVCQYT